MYGSNEQFKKSSQEGFNATTLTITEMDSLRTNIDTELSKLSQSLECEISEENILEKMAIQQNEVAELKANSKLVIAEKEGKLLAKMENVKSLMIEYLAARITPLRLEISEALECTISQENLLEHIESQRIEVERLKKLNRPRSANEAESLLEKMALLQSLLERHSSLSAKQLKSSVLMSLNNNFNDCPEDSQEKILAQENIVVKQPYQQSIGENLNSEEEIKKEKIPKPLILKSKEGEKEIHLAVENRVIIRVWTSCVNHLVPQHEAEHSKAEASVGHIAVEIGELYLSLWPEDSSVCEGAIVSAVPGVLQSYAEDKRLEGRAPERVICLYTLNARAIRKTFEYALLTLEGWTLLGGTRLIRRKDNQAHSCASFAQMLLEAGGLKRLLEEGLPKKKNGPKLTFLSNASDAASERIMMAACNYASVSPDSLLSLVSLAKIIESYAYPTTREAPFKYEEETPLEELKLSAGAAGFGTVEGIIEFIEQQLKKQIEEQRREGQCLMM